MRTHFLLQKRLGATFLAVFATSISSAQSMPQLVCKRLASSACGGSGQGGVQTIPTLLPLTAYGSASWTYTPPNDGINHVAFAYNLPNVSTMINGGFCGAATRNIAVVVTNTDQYATMVENTVIPASAIVSSSTMSYSTTNVLSKALSSTVETAAQANTYWNIVVKEGEWSLASTVTGKSWSRNASVCKLYVAGPVFYVPPTLFQ